MYHASRWLCIPKPPEKVDVKDNLVYLIAGTLGCGKAISCTGWFAREAVFGNRWGELE
jgi:hypothetical protein